MKASLTFQPPPPPRAAGASSGQSLLDVLHGEEYVVLSGDKNDAKRQADLAAWTERVQAGLQLDKMFHRVDGVEAIDFQPAATAQLMSWVRLRPSAGSCVERFSHTAVVVYVKGVRPVMVVFGGADAERKCVQSTVSSFDPEDNMWRSLPCKGPAPVPRTGHTAVMDDSGDRMIVIGGVSAFGERLDSVDVLHGLREKKDLRWNEEHAGNTRLADGDADPPAMVTLHDWCGCNPHHTASIWADDAANERARLDREFYNAHWSKYALRSDSERLPPISHHSCVRRGATLYVFGGSVGGGHSADLWALNMHNFGTEKQAPLSRTQVVLDNKKRKHAVITALHGQRIAFSWARVGVTGDVPCGRSSHTASMLDHNTMLVVGGILGNPTAADAGAVYTLNLNEKRWTRHRVHGLPALAYHTATVIPHTGRVLLFGGFVDGTAVSNVHVLDTHTWTVREVNVQGDIPRARGSHTAVLLGDQLVVSGGWSSSMQLVGDKYLMNHPFDSSGYASSLGADLLRAFDREEYSDVSFLVQGRLIHCHKVVLACRSVEMRALFSASDAPDVIDLGDRFGYDVFRAALMYLYCDRVVLPRASARELLAVAQAYGLEQLQSIAENCFGHVVIPPSTLNSDIGWAVTNRALSDLTVSVEGVDIPCHRVVLMNRSAYFKAMLTSGLREQQENRVVLHDIDRDIFSAVLKFIYTDSLESDAQLAFDLFCQSSIFRIPSLQDRTEQTLLGLISDDNIVPLLEASDVYSSQLLRDRCMLYVHRYFHNLSAAGIIAQLSPRLQDEIAAARRVRGQYVGPASLDATSQPDLNVYVDTEGTVCTKCTRPFVYVRKEWAADAPTPKDQLHKYARGLPVEFLDKIGVENTAAGHVASVRFKSVEYFVPRSYAQKQDAHQNAALVCLHAVQCGTKVPRKSE